MTMTIHFPVCLSVWPRPEDIHELDSPLAPVHELAVLSRTAHFVGKAGTAKAGCERKPQSKLKCHEYRPLQKELYDVHHVF